MHNQRSVAERCSKQIRISSGRDQKSNFQCLDGLAVEGGPRKEERRAGEAIRKL